MIFTRNRLLYSSGCIEIILRKSIDNSEAREDFVNQLCTLFVGFKLLYVGFIRNMDKAFFFYALALENFYKLSSKCTKKFIVFLA